MSLIKYQIKIDKCLLSKHAMTHSELVNCIGAYRSSLYHSVRFGENSTSVSNHVSGMSDRSDGIKRLMSVLDPVIKVHDVVITNGDTILVSVKPLNNIEFDGSEEISIRFHPTLTGDIIAFDIGVKDGD